MKKLTISLLLLSCASANSNSIHDKLVANIDQKNLERNLEQNLHKSLVNAHSHLHARVYNNQSLKADTEIEVEIDADAESEAAIDVEIEKKKKMKKKKMLRHNPEVKCERDKLARYDNQSLDSRIDFIQALLDDKDIEW